MLDTATSSAVASGRPQAPDSCGNTCISQPTAHRSLPKSVVAAPEKRSDSVSNMVGQWVVAQVRPRNEKEVAARLTVKGHSAYVPLVSRGTGSRQRWVPVFPQYVFACGEGDALFYALQEDAHVFSQINVRDQRRFVREMSEIQQAIAINPQLGISERLVVGRLVEVTRVDHPFRGRRGVIEYAGDKFKPTAKLVIGMSIFSRGVQVEIDPSDVEPVDAD